MESFLKKHNNLMAVAQKLSIFKVCASGDFWTMCQEPYYSFSQR